MDDASADELMVHLVNRANEIDEKIISKAESKIKTKNLKPSKKPKTIKSPEEISKELVERVASCTSKKGIHVDEKITSQPFFTELVKEQGWNIKDNIILVTQ